VTVRRGSSCPRVRVVELNPNAISSTARPEGRAASDPTAPTSPPEGSLRRATALADPANGTASSPINAIVWPTEQRAVRLDRGRAPPPMVVDRVQDPAQAGSANGKPRCCSSQQPTPNDNIIETWTA